MKKYMQRGAPISPMATLNMGAPIAIHGMKALF
jgi:hypothetical protein